MRYRTFGRTGWVVSEVGYGMWAMGKWNSPDDEEFFLALQHAVELGCNFFDTAWQYGAGRSEALLGRLIRANPHRRLYTATKVPPKNGTLVSRREFSLDDTFPPHHIREYVAKSLENAGIDCFDLVHFHTWEDHWLEDDRWIRTMEDLKRQGVIRAVGISLNRWEPWNGVRAVRSGLVDAVQVIYNVFDQNPEDELLPACAMMNVAVIARVPLDEGSLTGTLTAESTWPDGDWRNIYFATEHLQATVERVDALQALLPSEMNMPEMALRFVLANPVISTVIPGMRTQCHVDANVACSDGGALPTDLVAQLRTHRWDRQPALITR